MGKRISKSIFHNKMKKRKFDGKTYFLTRELGSVGRARASAGYWRERKYNVRIIKAHFKNTGTVYQVWVSENWNWDKRRKK